MKIESEVLARKYRPSNFEELIGQESIAQTLSLALDSNRISHAYLLSGLRGSGKTSTARIFAKALVCDSGPTSKPCGTCTHCTMADESRHIDIIEMDAASSRKIDDIRDLIENTKYKPSAARFKIFIIDEVHMLTKEAFNALLKTLEEPPEYVKFILATTDPLKLPATILSRTQHFRFKKISNQNIVQHLAHILHLENIEYEQESLEILARSGSGSLRDTLTLLDQAIIYSKNYVDVKTVTNMLGLVDPAFIASIFDAIFAKDHTKIIRNLKELEDYEAEMVVDELIAFLKEKLFCKDPIYTTLILDRWFRILSDSKSLFSINADSSFVLSLLFFKMMEALRIKEIDQMIESLESEIKRPASIAVTHQEIAPVTEEEVKQVQEEPTPNSNTVTSNKQFDELCNMIMDRSSDLGECFKEQIHFISFADDVLTWESCANENCKAQLRNGYGVIKHFVQEIFGFNTKIKSQACAKEIETVTQKKTKKQVIQPHIDEPISMIEENEISNASCVTNCTEDDTSTQEFNTQDLLDEPMVKKATELFEATKITIQSKV
ncbi:MAG: DNA polymerase III subunit gamma/tau [Campylobacterota bacterium]|nr:DNA polymerase III subunit gamma/tau [Campylobacterota bacterium]